MFMYKDAHTFLKLTLHMLGSFEKKNLSREYAPTKLAYRSTQSTVESATMGLLSWVVQ